MSNDPLEPGKTNLAAKSMEKEVGRKTQAARTRQVAWSLSLFGAVPLVVLAAALMVMDTNGPLYALAFDGLKTYSAIILSFLGGVRWGLAMKAQDPTVARRVMAISVFPALVGWMSLFLPAPYVFGVLILAFAAHGAWDSFAGQKGVFGLWFVQLRSALTFIVCGALVIAFFATTS